MRTPISRLERITGLFVVLVVGGVLAFLALRSGEPRRDLELHLRLAKTHGLAPGSVVKMNDLPIGRVSAVELALEPGAEDAPIHVTLQVDERHRRWVRRGARAEIAPSLLPGIHTAEVFLSLTLGEAPLADGAWLPVDPPTGLIEDYKTIPQELRAALQPALESVEEMSGYVRKITRDVAEERGLMGSLVSDARLRSDVLALIARLDRILGGFEEAVPSVRTAAEQAVALTTRLQGVAERADATLGSADRLLGELQPHVVRVGPLLDEATATLANARVASASSVELLARLQRTIDERVDPLLARATAAFDRVDDALSGLPHLLRTADALLADARRLAEALKHNVFLRGSLPAPRPLRTERGGLPRGGARD